MKENKLVVLGAGGVGKTALVLQFLQGVFSPAYKPTVEDCYSHTLQLPNGLFHSLEILDTSGSHDFPAMRELSIRSGRAFLLVFDVTCRQSFSTARHLYHLIARVKDDPQVPCVLVGNKVDVSGSREVSWEAANTFASETMAGGVYLETSAKYSINVDLVFRELLILTFGFGKEKKERRGSRLRLSLSDLSITSRRKSSGAVSLGSGGTFATVSGISHASSALSDDTPEDDLGKTHRSSASHIDSTTRNKKSSPTNLGVRHEKCLIL